MVSNNPGGAAVEVGAAPGGGGSRSVEGLGSPVKDQRKDTLKTIGKDTLKTIGKDNFEDQK